MAPASVSDSTISKPGGFSRRAVLVAFLLGACTFFLIQYVWSSQILSIGLVLEQFSSNPPANSTQSLKSNADPPANATESRKSSADAAEGEAALNGRNNLVAEELVRKEKPEEIVSIRDDEVADAPVQLNHDGSAPANATIAEREESLDEVVPRAIPRTWKPPKNCATVEEMGAATVGDTRAASLRVRAMIERYIGEHGAERVRNLTSEEFCQHGFVLVEPPEEGFGNNMYQVLTAAGVAMMVNRSIIIGECEEMRPTWDAQPIPMRKRAFEDYVDFSNETFRLREVRKLWAIHRCETKYNRSLIVRTDTLVTGFREPCICGICEDWATRTAPIIEIKGATGAGAIQFFLKNAHPAMRTAAVKLLGNPAIPDSRPNTFGELFRAFIAPNAGIQEAVQWALKGGPNPDITLHLRMQHMTKQQAPAAASSCINRILQQISLEDSARRRRPRVVVVTDTPSIVPELKTSLGQEVEVVQFDYLEYAKGMPEDSVMSLNHGLPAADLIEDWGALPRSVAMVDFFLAARARTAVVSGAYIRVSTTYAQLIAALAAAYTLDEREVDAPRPACVYYSSFRPGLLKTGLNGQYSWGSSWRSFGGKLGCLNQTAQCAEGALLPYTWWDAPWQSPNSADISTLKDMVGLDERGQVSEKVMDKFCAAARETEVELTTLEIPSYEEAIAAA